LDVKKSSLKDRIVAQHVSNSCGDADPPVTATTPPFRGIAVAGRGL
jgi:hypothetical protein